MSTPKEEQVPSDPPDLALQLDEAKRHAAEFRVAFEDAQRALTEALIERDGHKRAREHLQFTLEEAHRGFDSAKRKMFADYERYKKQAADAYVQVEPLQKKIEELQEELKITTKYKEDFGRQATNRKLELDALKLQLDKLAFRNQQLASTSPLIHYEAEAKALREELDNVKKERDELKADNTLLETHRSTNSKHIEELRRLNFELRGGIDKELLEMRAKTELYKGAHEKTLKEMKLLQGRIHQLFTTSIDSTS